ncbi:hypothetical protein NOR_06442 [Metarhizium rileyi]|uniref:Uncharacterized protein n=1 Tax=Metarhizium rileyi (strain RCEF 4871) TaxID=1649241 RepID=A0A162ITQ3_METRR|nr:hypothetical protein NOR_06442 [Metarhizium rileyi RCEF 4871]
MPTRLALSFLKGHLYCTHIRGTAFCEYKKSPTAGRHPSSQSLSAQTGHCRITTTKHSCIRDEDGKFWDPLTVMVGGW